jgi:hypothetical protein
MEALFFLLTTRYSSGSGSNQELDKAPLSANWRLGLHEVCTTTHSDEMAHKHNRGGVESPQQSGVKLKSTNMIALFPLGGKLETLPFKGGDSGEVQKTFHNGATA